MTRFLTLAAALTMAACVPKPAELEAPVDLVWPAPPETARVRWAGFIETSAWADPPTPWQRFTARLSGKLAITGFKKPYGVTVAADGRVLVSDTGWGRVAVFDREQHSFSWLGADGQGALTQPAGLVTDDRGHAFVADMGQAAVYEYTPEGAFVRTYGGGQLERPTGVAIDEEAGRLWIVDIKRHLIEVYEIGGEHLFTVGERGGQDGQFNFPTAVASGPDGEMFVMDTFNFRIQVIDRDGAYVRKWGRNCDAPGCFAKSKGIGVSSDGRVFVSDAAFNLVQVFDREGTLLMAFGGGGAGPGELFLPAGVHVSDDDVVHVVSQYTWRVNRYAYLGAQRAPEASPEP